MPEPMRRHPRLKCSIERCRRCVAGSGEPGRRLDAISCADSLFRADQPKPDASPQQATGEAGRILAKSVANGSLDPGHRAYLAKLVAARTGLSQQDAEKRVDDVVAQMKAAGLWCK